MSNLRALLHHEVLTSTYDKGAPGVLTPLTDRFYTSPQNWDTNEASFLTRPVTRKAAPLNKPFATAHQLALQGKSKSSGAIFNSFNSFTLSPEVFQGLMEPESMVIQKIARRECNDQMEHFSRMHAVQKELVLAKILLTGEVHIDPNGQVLESSSGAETSATFGVDATHQNQADGILTASWATDTTDIASHIEGLRDRARQESAPPPDLAICNSSIKAHLRSNDDFQLFAAQHVEGQRTLYGEFVEGLFGIDWLFLDSYYEDSTGTARKYIPDEKVVMVPKSNDWLTAVAGLTMVPTSIDIQGSMESWLGSLAETYGTFAYAKGEHNPARLEVFAGDAYGWIVRDPNAIWQLDVIF